MLKTITHKIDLNMSQPNNFQYVHVMQNDYDAEYIQCTLYDGNEPYTISCPKDSITVKCQLPNCKEVEDSIESIDNNIVTFKVTNKMTQVQGNILAALSLFDTNGRISPFPFIIKVIAAPEGITDDDIMYGKLAEYYANLAKSYAVGTNNEVRDGDVTDNSKFYCQKAAQHAKDASDAVSNVKKSELSASKYSDDAAESAKQAAKSAKDASESAKDASESAKQADKSADNAKKTEQTIDNKASSTLANMTTKEGNAKKYADLARSYAVGTNNEVRDGDATDSSKYYWELVKNAIDNGQLAEFEYFETYADFEKALKNNELREDILAVIKENVYKPSGAGNCTIQIDDELLDDSENAVQNKVITKTISDLRKQIASLTINDLEKQISSMSQELKALKELITENDNNEGNVNLGNWKFTCSEDGNANYLTGKGIKNYIESDNSMWIQSGSDMTVLSFNKMDILSSTQLNLQGTNEMTIASRCIRIVGNDNGDIHLEGKVYINGKLIE